MELHLRKNFGYFGKGDKSKPLKIDVSYRYWPPIYSDQLFTPRLKVKVTNLGRLLEKASITLSIGKVEIEDLVPKDIPESSWVPVAFENINKLYPGKDKQFYVTISSGKLIPGRYQFKLELTELIPNKSPIAHLNQTLENLSISEAEKDEKRQQKIKECQSRGINPYEKSNSYTPMTLCSYKFNEIMKVHSLSSVAGIIGALVGSTIAAGGTFLYATIRFINEYWPK